MMTQPETFPYQSESESRGPASGATAVALALPLILLASLLWSGVVLVGVAFLCLAVGLLVAGLVSQRYYGVSAWGTVIMGQLVGMGGVVVLLLAAL